MALHVIIGRDDFLVDEAARRIIGEDPHEEIDSILSTNEESRLADIARALNDYLTPPFLEPRKVTWWRNVRFLPGAVKAGNGAAAEGEERVSEAVKEALARLAAKFAAAPLADNQEFIISGPSLLVTSEFARTLKTAGELVVFAEKKPGYGEVGGGALARVAERARELGLDLPPPVAAAFVAKVGDDTRSLFSELAKLRDYLGDERRSVTAADIGEIVSEGVGKDTMPWDLTDAIGERDAAKAVDAYLKLTRTRNAEVGVVSAIEGFLRQLVEFKAAFEEGHGAEATRAMKPFFVNKYRRFVAKWTLMRLRVARQRFLILRERLVSSAAEAAEALVLAEIIRAIK